MGLYKGEKEASLKRERLSAELADGCVMAVYVTANFLLNYTCFRRVKASFLTQIPQGYSLGSTDEETWFLFTYIDNHTQSGIPFLHNTIII